MKATQVLKATAVAMLGFLALTGCSQETPSILDKDGGVPTCEWKYWESPEECYMDVPEGKGTSFYVPAGPTSQGPREEIMAGEIVHRGMFWKERVVPAHR